MAFGVNETVALIVLTPILFLPIVAIVAAVYFAIRQKTLVGVAKLVDSHAWLTGVNKSYLDKLPSWQD